MPNLYCTPLGGTVRDRFVRSLAEAVVAGRGREEAYLLPSSYLLNEVRQHMRDMGLSGYEQPNLLSFDELVDEILHLAGVRRWFMDRMTQELLVNKVLAEVRSSVGLPYFNSIAEFPGYVSAVTSLLAEIKRTGASPDEFAAAAAAREWPAKDQEVHVIYCAYQNSLAILLLAGILVWGKFHPPGTVTFETREQAATPAGVEKAANAAQVSISPLQAADIANVIKENADRAPDAVVKTTGESLDATIKTELHKAGGQFAIVTDSKKPASIPVPLPDNSKAATTLANAGALPPGTPVTLNQYNIKAYPDRLIQVGGSYQEVLAAYSWKIDVPKIPLVTPHGAVGYLGVYGHANFDRPDMSRVGILLTIPK